MKRVTLVHSFTEGDRIGDHSSVEMVADRFVYIYHERINLQNSGGAC